METEALINILWVLTASSLIFVMQMGFLCLEAGVTRSKNAINVAIKNLTDFGISTLAYWGIGFGLMFGVSFSGMVGTNFFFLPLDMKNEAATASFFLFQVMFCGTAVTIISGAVAERIRFGSYLIVAALIATVVYPFFGHWAWGGGIGEASSVGWLKKIGFIDFAGSTVVHSVGGWAALATLLIVGPRIGRFPVNGPAQKISGNNLPMAMLGVFLLWFGWIGFNGGSTLAMNEQVPSIIVNTMLAAASGMVTGLLVGWRVQGYPDTLLVMNGTLAGLVAITASCFAVSAASALIIGAVGAVFMIAAVSLLEKLKIDDVVGAIPVHAVAGVWGTLALPLFGDLEKIGTGLSRLEQFQVQLIGVAVCFLFAFGVTYLVLKMINRFFHFRISLNAELIGLNVSEHKASTEILDLLTVMEKQRKTKDLSLRVPVEPFTEVGQIARLYNRVMSSLEKAITQTKAIVSTATDAIISFSSEDHRIYFINPATSLLFGHPENEILGNPFTFLIATAEEHKGEEILSHLNGKRALEVFGKKKDGSLFPVEVNISEAKIGKQSFFTGIIRDITERKKAEAALLQSEEKLRQSQKMEAIGHLSGSVAHDFNNLLTIIIGNSDLLSMKLNSNSDLAPFAGEIQKAGERGKALTEKLLAFSRKQVITPEVLSLNEFIRYEEQMLRRLIPEMIEFSILLDPDIKNIKADKGQLSQVLINLVVNAVDAMMPKSGRLLIESKEVTLDQNYISRNREIKSGQYVQLSVTDTGQGMSEETQARLFEPFFTTKEKGKGTGLGLSTVFGIVKQSNGYIFPYSELGHGTTFKLYFPLIEEKVSERKVKANEDPKDLFGKETILFVEDEFVVQETVTKMLQKWGYHVITVKEPEEALLVFEENKDKIDLFLTDVIMPRLRGPELAEKILKLKPQLKVLFISGYTDHALDYMIEKEDKIHFLSKPFSSYVLAVKLKEVFCAPPHAKAA